MQYCSWLVFWHLLMVFCRCMCSLAAISTEDKLTLRYHHWAVLSVMNTSGYVCTTYVGSESSSYSSHHGALSCSCTFIQTKSHKLRKINCSENRAGCLHLVYGHTCMSMQHTQNTPCTTSSHSHAMWTMYVLPHSVGLIIKMWPYLIWWCVCYF